MGKRLAVILMFGALALSGCNKGKKTAKRTPLLNPSPVPTAAATAIPKPTATTPTPPLIDKSAEVIVFGYHRFEKKIHRPDTEITPEAFEAQMKQLQDHKIAVIKMQDFLAWKRGEKNIPAHSAIITIDDGYKSGYEVAWPILKKFNYPFTLFIYTEGVKGGKFGGGAAMSWEQLAEMRDAGVDIEAHSETHQDLRRPYNKVTKRHLNPQEYHQWLEDEIGGSKAVLEQRLGIRVDCFAIPFGYYNQQVREICKQTGYEALFTVYGQKLTYGSDNYSLGRYMIEANKPKVFEDAIKFGGSSGAGSEMVEQIPTASLRVQPADGSTVNDRTPLIRANLGGIAQLDAQSVKMRVSGMGLVPAKLDPATKIISYQVTQPIRGDACTVILEAKSGGKKLAARWSFNIKEAAATSPAPATPKK